MQQKIIKLIFVFVVVFVPAVGQDLLLQHSINDFPSRGTADETADGKNAVWVISDSKGAGSNNDEGDGADLASGILWEYDGSTIVPITTGDVSTINASNGSPWKSFASSRYTNTGKSTVIVATGQGGAEFSPNGDNTNWSASGSLYAPAKTKAQNCLTFLGLQKFKGIFIILGVNDVRATPVMTVQALATVQADIAAFFVTLTTDFPDTPIYIIQIGRSASGLAGTQGARLGAIRGYLRNIVEAYPNVYFVGNESAMVYGGGFGADNLHYNATGNIQVGNFFEKAIRFKDAGYHKWAVSVLAAHFDEPTTNYKNAVNTFITNNTAGFLDTETFFWGITTDQKNTFVDWRFMAGPVDHSSSFSSNSHVAFNGSSTYINMGWAQSTYATKSSIDDYAVGIKIKTKSGSGTAIGSTIAAPSSHIQIAETGGSVGLWKLNDVTTSNNAEALGNGNEWVTSRVVTATKVLYKNGVSNATASVSSTNMDAESLFVGCLSNGGSPTSYLNSQVEWWYTQKASGIDRLDWYNSLETMKSSMP